jgi:hypothetical protein
MSGTVWNSCITLGKRGKTTVNKIVKRFYQFVKIQSGTPKVEHLERRFLDLSQPASNFQKSFIHLYHV